VDRERMHAGGEFRGQRGINCAVPIDAALAAEDFRHDMDAVMRLPSGPMPGMARVEVGFIVDAKTFRSESFRQFLCDDILCLHIASVFSGFQLEA
jgi:hypothetical protein